MKIDFSKETSFLYDYLNNSSPTGFESSGQKLWLDYINPYIDEWAQDAYGSVYGVINPGQDYKVVIEAHADEISWFVNFITKEGFIHVVRNGGSDNVIAPAKRVNIYTDKGIVKGVFGWPAIHTRKANSKDANPTVEKLFIDVGAANDKEVEEMGIHVGCVITFQDDFTEMNNYYVGRALDNRLGGFAVAQVARLLSKKKVKLPYSLYIVNAVQEEIGLKGAHMMAHRIKPDLAIVTDVTHDTSTPMIDSKIHGSVKCGLGPSLTYAPAVQNNLLKYIIEVAKEKDIPFQRQASSRSTGTDTDSFAYSNQGVPSALISLPLKYMHTTVEMAHKDDLKSVVELMYEVLVKLEAGQNFLYL